MSPTPSDRTPSDRSGITAEWLTHATGMPIDALVVEQIGGGAGFMGQVFRATLTSNAPGCPQSVIVKLPTNDPGARFIGEMMRVWEREHLC